MFKRDRQREKEKERESNGHRLRLRRRIPASEATLYSRLSSRVSWESGQWPGSLPLPLDFRTQRTDHKNESRTDDTHRERGRKKPGDIEKPKLPSTFTINNIHGVQP